MFRYYKRSLCTKRGAFIEMQMSGETDVGISIILLKGTKEDVLVQIIENAVKII